MITVPLERVTLVSERTRFTPPRGMTAILTVLLVSILGAGLWLFAPSSHTEVAPPANLEEYEYVDGVLSSVELPLLILNAYESVGGETELTFRVPDENLKYFDVVHLRAHSSIGLPTRIFFEELDGELVAVYKIDAPANSGNEG